MLVIFDTFRDYTTLIWKLPEIRNDQQPKPKVMMKCILMFFLTFSISAFSQNAKYHAEVELKKALYGESNPQFLDGKALKDSISAIKAAEKFLFKEYGKEIIEAQKPYQIYLINNHWVIWGNSINSKRFLIILERRNSRILKHEIQKLK